MEIKGRTISHYRITGKLGEGGMGVVYQAEDLILERTVALKFLNREALNNPESKERFLREARAAAKLDHPNVCTVYEIGEHDGQAFLSMAFIEGQTLKEKIAQRPLKLDEALDIAIQAGEGLRAAHEKGIVHRDIKSANLMLTADGKVKVMDFGLAQLAGQGGLTKSWTTLGTVAYMSPEQAQRKPVDLRSDIWSLGVVIYQMVTGRLPFEGEHEAAVLYSIIHSAPELITAVRAGLPAALDHVVSKAMAKDPGERYQYMADLLVDLRALQKGLPVSAPVRLRRRNLLIGAAGAAAVGGGLSWMYVGNHLSFWRGSRTALGFQGRDWILVTDFDNQTGDPVFDKSLRTALTIGIQQSTYVNVFPDARIAQTLERMQRKKAETLDENLGSEVAVREGIKCVIVCGISKVGDLYSLTVRLVDPATRATAGTHAVQAKGKNGVLPALDALARQVREHLGESLEQIPERMVPLPRATTSSLEALKAYAGSLRASIVGNAFQLGMQQAVELDPDFALAHMALGWVYYLGGNGATGEPHFKKALSLLDRLTVRERLWVQAVVEDSRGNRELAVDRYKSYLAQYPDDYLAWFRLGWTQMATLGQFEDAIESFGRSLQLDHGSSSCYVNLATCYGALGNYPEAIAKYQKAFELRPDLLQEAIVNHEYGFVLVKSGDIAKARGTFESMLRLEAGLKARGHRSLALLDLYQGRYRNAVIHLREAILVSRATKAPAGELRNRLILAGALHTMGQVREVSAELNHIERLLSETRFAPSYLAIAGKLFSRTGRVQMASKLTKDLAVRLRDPTAVSSMNREARMDQADLHHMEGIVDLANGRAAKAIEAFELAAKLSSSATILDSFAAAYAAAGKTDLAVQRYRELLAKRHLGTEVQEYWILAHYQLGVLHELQKETGQAKECYQKLLDLWKEGDADLRPLEDARARLARL